MSPRRALYDAIRAAEAAEVAVDTRYHGRGPRLWKKWRWRGGLRVVLEWWSPRREVFDTAASRLEQLLHGELLGDLRSTAR